MNPMSQPNFAHPINTNNRPNETAGPQGPPHFMNQSQYQWQLLQQHEAQLQSQFGSPSPNHQNSMPCYPQSSLNSSSKLSHTSQSDS
jgi:hypothetical protein